MFNETVDLAALILAVATLYAAVGQAGASGYLAVMGIVGLDPAMMKPTALALNLLVATIGTVRFARAGLFEWRSFYPFGVLGMPFSFLGGMLHLPSHLYYPVVGGILLMAALELARSTWAARGASGGMAAAKPPFFPALASGAAIGFLSGMTGTGGGIFLAPLILLMGWVETRRAAAVSAAYNLLNSSAALAGAWTTFAALPSALPWWLAAAGVGGAVGAWLGSRHLPTATLRYLLSTILALSGMKMLAA
ncbi:MAG TPA: sulfite exporter TauE/SafE family protein [Azospirillum sp.]